MQQQPASTAAVSPTRAVDRALALLSVVCTADSVTLADAARTTGLAPSTALRLLRSLESLDFVDRAADGAFGPGTRMMQLGALALRRESLVRLADAPMAAIAAATGESTYLSIRGAGANALYIAVAEGSHAIRHAGWVGRTVPLGPTAAGAALTGAVQAGEYVVRRSVVETDVVAVAAPVGRTDGVVAALSVVGPAYRLDEDTAHAHGRLLAAAATDLSTRLGVTA